MTEFHFGRTSTSDAERTERPNEVATSETIERTHGMVLATRKSKERKIMEAIGKLDGSGVSILKDSLAVRKQSARWVLRVLTIDYERNCVTTSMND